MGAKLQYSIVAAAVVVLGVAMAFRYQKPLQEKLFASRLAQDLPPDEAVKAARALDGVAADPDAAFERLAPEAKLRYLLATGYSMQEVAPRVFKGKDDPQQDLATLDVARAREQKLTLLVHALTAAHPRIAERFASASRPEVRRRALHALGFAGDLAALPTARAALSDPDPSVRVAALTAGTLICRRANDTPARMSFLTEAVKADGLAARALDASDFATDKAAIPVLVAYIDRPKANDLERHNAADAIRALLGPTATASAPGDNDPAAWREWLARQPKP